jgi:hypothetical protein
MQVLIEFFFGSSNTQLDYLTWVPLNERGDLKAENVLFQRFSDSINGYAISFPEHWQLDNVDSTNFFLAPYMTDGMRPTIAITPNQSPISTDLNVYGKYVLDELSKVKTDITGTIENKAITFQQMPAYEMTYYRLRTFNEGRTYIKQAIRAYVFFRNNIAYLVEYRNGIGDFEKSKALVDRSIETLNFRLPCTSFCVSW